MDLKVTALVAQRTWDLIPRQTNTTIVMWKWVSLDEFIGRELYESSLTSNLFYCKWMFE
ncbi:unnamed protein product [Spirodela intermedia]|uniref:Uncharacterized protein n=2 Tax=Spirodela intermedia TaxID=51605 RepID=A0A7I8K6N2_SPIIN|nr:unnamed protein product [Spirodela intermedia]CAA6656645.1 unnamed protein product [Spirodela intermedia]CAA7392338.1 unnamed protein product [Spirodela intermedia]